MLVQNVLHQSLGRFELPVTCHTLVDRFYLIKLFRLLNLALLTSILINLSFYLRRHLRILLSFDRCLTLGKLLFRLVNLMLLTTVLSSLILSLLRHLGILRSLERRLTLVKGLI